MTLHQIVGRESLLAQLEARTKSPGLLALVGPPGVGKTTIARAWRHSIFCAVGDLGDPTLLGRRIKAAMGVSADADLAQVLATRDPMRIVLDAFDTLMPHGLDAVEQLCEQTPTLCVVLTSKVIPPVSVTSIEVGPLDPHGALEILGLEPSSAARALCKRLDHLPLALVVAAPWLQTMTPAEFLSALDRGPLLNGGPLDETLLWSWSQLTPESQRALARATVFVTSFNLNDAAQVLAEAEHLAITALHRLVSRSLIQRRVDGGESRYQLLDSVRTFARQRLGSSERDHANQAHATAFGTGRPRPRDAVPDLLISVFRPDAVPEIRAAWQRTTASPELTLGLVAGMHLIGITESSGQEHTAMLVRARAAAHAVGASALYPLFDLFAAQGAWSAGLPTTEALFELVRVSDAGLVSALGTALSWWWTEDPDAAFAQAFDAAEGFEWARLYLTNSQGLSWLRQGRFEDAKHLLHRALESARSLGEDGLALILAASHGAAAFEAGDLTAAQRSYEFSAALARFQMPRLRGRGWLAMVAAQASGDIVHADTLTQVARALRALGARGWAGKFDCRAGLSFAASGRAELAIQHLVHGVADLDASKRAALAARARCWLAAAYLLAGQRAEARTALQNAQGPLPALEEQQVQLYAAVLDEMPLQMASGWVAAVRDALLRGDSAHPPGRRLEHSLAFRVGQRYGVGQPKLALNDEHVVFPDRQRLNLRRKPTVARLLRALVDNHLATPTNTLSVDALISAVWPNEVILPGPARHRLHATVSILRRAGLGEVLETVEGGYRLKPSLQVLLEAQISSESP